MNNQQDFFLDEYSCSDSEADYVSSSDSELDFDDFYSDSVRPQIFRQYTITCEQDWIDIREGFCPKYATWWDDKFNRLYWADESKIKYRSEYIRCCLAENHEPIPSFHQNSVSISPPEKCQLSRSITDGCSVLDAQLSKKVHFDVFREVLVFDDNHFSPLENHRPRPVAAA